MIRCASIPPLAGHLVGSTGDRRTEELTAHLSALGATVVHGPVLHTHAITTGGSHLRAATRALIDDPPDHLLVTTGIGLRGWMNAAAAWGLERDLRTALRCTRILARGPKAVGAVAEAGLDVWFTEPTGQTSAMVDHVLGQVIPAAHVAVQLPGAPMPELVDRLRRRGVRVTTIEVYDWTWPADLGPARRLLRAIVDATVSAVVFTSRPAVRNLVALAAAEGVEAQLCGTLGGLVVPACIGPVTAQALWDLTGATAVLPDRPMLGMLAPAVAAALRESGHRHLRTSADEHVVVQGRRVDGRATVHLSEREAAALHHLMENAARTVPRDDVLTDTTVARLRRRIAPAGLSVRTVTGRGYLLDAVVTECWQRRSGADGGSTQVVHLGHTVPQPGSVLTGGRCADSSSPSSC